jgi:hypothetical protein
MRDIKRSIENRVEGYNNQFNDNMKKLQENFTYFLSWKAEETYKARFKADYLNQVLEEIAEHGYAKAFEHNINVIRRFLKSGYNVRENSTNAISNETSTWKYIANIELLELIEDYKTQFESEGK